MPRAARAESAGDSAVAGAGRVAAIRSAIHGGRGVFLILPASVDKGWEDLHGEHKDECCDGRHRKGFEDQCSVDCGDHELSPNGKCFPSRSG